MKNGAINIKKKFENKAGARSKKTKKNKLKKL